MTAGCLALEEVDRIAVALDFDGGELYRLPLDLSFCHHFALVDVQAHHERVAGQIGAANPKAGGVGKNLSMERLKRCEVMFAGGHEASRAHREFGAVGPADQEVEPDQGLAGGGLQKTSVTHPGLLEFAVDARANNVLLFSIDPAFRTAADSHAGGLVTGRGDAGELPGLVAVIVGLIPVGINKVAFDGTARTNEFFVQDILGFLAGLAPCKLVVLVYGFASPFALGTRRVPGLAVASPTRIICHAWVVERGKVWMERLCTACI